MPLAERHGRQLKEGTFAYILLLPTLLVVLGVIIYPLLKTFETSLYSIQLTKPWLGRPFVGLGNYIEMLREPYLWQALGRTVYFSVVSIGMELVLGTAIALLLNQEFRGRWLLRSIVLLPWALPTVVNAAMWRWIYNPEYGALNALLTQLHLMENYRSWLSDPVLAMNMVIFADVWKMTPLVVLLLLAALQNIPKSLYEAARVDGAGSWRSFWRVTLPLLQPTFLVIIVMRTMETLKVFDIVYVLTRGGPANGTQVIAYYAYTEAFSQLRFGSGAAVAYFIAFVTAIFALVYIRAMRREIDW